MDSLFASATPALGCQRAYGAARLALVGLVVVAAILLAVLWGTRQPPPVGAALSPPAAAPSLLPAGQAPMAPDQEPILFLPSRTLARAFPVGIVLSVRL